MLKINIICVGKIKENYWQDAILEYLKRLSRFALIKIVEIEEAKFVKGEKGISQMLEKEGEGIIKAISGIAFALDLKGDSYSSEDLSSLIYDNASSGNSELSFIIGGSWGLSQKVKASAKSCISFGKVTFPHQMMRVILLEQIYRAITIRENICYHK